MSMELKGAAGGKAEKVEAERQSKAVRSRSKSRPRDEKTRRQSSKLEEEKEEKIVKEEVTEVEKESKRVESRRKKEKIVVSKMARSDRPLREKSPEKGRRREEDEEERRQKDKIEEEEEDYRLSLNRKREKFTRSVSQPGPPPSLDFLLPAVTNRSSGKGAVTSSKLGSGGSQKIASNSRTDSFGDSGPALRRSNTLQEEVVGERNVGTVYDNLGFDCSPDLRTGSRAADKRQQTLAALKDTIQVQLARGAPLSLPSSGGRRGKDARRYQPMSEEEEVGGVLEEGKTSDS